MTNVSTRPRKGATTVAETATPVISSATSVAASGPVEDAAICAAFAKLEDLFDRAAHTDEPHAHSGESDRLLRIASTLAGKFAGGDREHENIQQNFAFDLASLVRAARLVPGDTESPERTALIEQCRPILQHFTGEASEDLLTPPAARPTLGVRFLRVNRDTPLDQAGDAGRNMARLCAWDIEPIALELMRIADEQRGATTIEECRSEGVLRMLGARLVELNSIIMSYLDDDSRTLGDCLHDYGRGTVALEEVLR